MCRRTLTALGYAALIWTAGCKHTKVSPPPLGKSRPAAAAEATSALPPPSFEVQAVSTEKGQVTWYEVAPGSLPARRAWREEFTAAHDRLPIGTYLRVNNPANGRSTIVRVTDHGIHRKNTVLDVSRAAAEELGMVEAGSITARLEVLKLTATTAGPVPAHSDNQDLTAKPVDSKTDMAGKLQPDDPKLPPGAPTPATRDDEKAAATAKSDTPQVPTERKSAVR